MTSTITDIKNDHEKKRPGVKFESSNLTVATVKEKMNKEPTICVGAKLKGAFTAHLKSIMAKHKQVNVHTLC